MIVPVRLQLSRRDGFNLQCLSKATNGLPAVNVARPSRWGNLYRVWKDDDGKWTVSWCSCHWVPVENTKESAIVKAVELHRADVTVEGPHNYRCVDPVPTRADIIKGLRGRNVACTCRLGEPCHGDTLLEISNSNLGVDK